MRQSIPEAFEGSFPRPERNHNRFSDLFNVDDGEKIVIKIVCHKQKRDKSWRDKRKHLLEKQNDKKKNLKEISRLS